MNETGFSVDVRAEIAMVCFLVAACTANVKKAASASIDFSYSVHGVGVETPLVTPNPVEKVAFEGSGAFAPTLGLVRKKGDYIQGSPQWLSRASEGAVLGALSLDEGAITNVDPDVSARHARIFFDGVKWLVEGLGSKNGTVLVSGLDGSSVTVEPPKSDRNGAAFSPVEIHPGDELILGSSTRFIVIEGLPG